ncbi:hypothetical protein, partial [Waltera sp.]|uniref:hypothetical protein n=1 Tax=Waltera sp. TaxID=2815806 RepID=UPI003AB989A5
YDALLSQSVAVHKRSQYDRNASLGTLWYRRLLTALLILIPSRGYWFFESFPKRRTPGVCGAMSKMFVGGC